MSASITNTHLNLSQDVLVLTEDKLRLCLIDKLQRLESGRAWATPLGILLTVVATLVATDFKDFVVPKATWQALFILVAIGTAGWLARCLYDIAKAPTIEEVVAELKRGSVDVDAE